MSGIRILLVEDDEMVAAHIAVLVEELGHVIVNRCASGEAALRAVSEFEPALVLMDIVLQGGMDGIETAAQLCHNTDLPVIYLTSHSEETLLQRAKVTEPYAYLIKPLQLDQLRVAIEVGLYRHQQVLQQRKLEQQILAKNAQLENMNLELAQRNADLKTFAYTVSHDLKAPIRAMSGYAFELEHHHAQISDRARFCMQQIASASINLSELIDDLSAYASVGCNLPAVEEFVLSSLVNEVLLDRHSDIQQFSIEVDVNIANTILVRCARNALRQVLVNLLDNAIKYRAAAKSAQISISVTVLTQWYRIRFADNGIGFEMSNHDRVFELFQRLDGESEIEGTGAGLAIARKLMEKIGGKIYAEATPNAGACFFVDIPRC